MKRIEILKRYAKQEPSRVKELMQYYFFNQRLTLKQFYEIEFLMINK